MLKRFYIYLLLLFLVCLPLYAGDLDDGISMDEDLDDTIELKPNIDFIIRNARAKAQRAIADGKETNDGCNGTGNLIFGPGADLDGATILNSSDNEGTSTVCIER